MRPLLGATALVVLLGVLSGCGDDGGEPEAQESMITAIGDPTPSVSDTPVGGEPSETETTRPPKPKPTAPTTPKPPAPSTIDVTSQSAQLLDALDAAFAKHTSVHVSTGAATGARVLESDHRYGSDSDYNATLTLPTASVTLRRIAGVLYAQTKANGPFSSIGPGDPRLAGDAPDLDVIRGLLAWKPLDDLRAVVRGASALKLVGQATIGTQSVVQVSLKVDASDLPTSAALPVGLTGAVEVTLSVDGVTSLPVRCDYVLPSGATARVEYRGWGTPVTVVKPPVS